MFCLPVLNRVNIDILYITKKNKGFMILKMTGLSPGFQCKSWFEKFALSPELLTNICKNNLCCQTQLSYFGTFCAISSDLVHAFQSQFLRWDLKLKPVVLCTMNPVKRGKFSLIIKGPFTLHVASIRTRVQISTGTRSFVKNKKIWYFANKMLYFW